MGDQLKEWLRIFCKLDANGTGHISCKQFLDALGLKGLAPSTLDHVMNFFDTDDSGMIEYREFVQSLALITGQCSAETCAESRVKLAFLLCDTDGRGLVWRQSVLAWLDGSVTQMLQAYSPGSCSFSDVGVPDAVHTDELLDFDG